MRCRSCVVAMLLVSVVVGIWTITSGQEGRTAVKHPVLTHRIDATKAGQYERDVARVMAMSEAEMLRLVPMQSGVMFCGCPNCTGGQQENNQFEWTIEKPFELRCRFCGHVYPSDQYPMKWTATGANMLGEPVAFRYYYDEKGGRDFWFEAHADYLRRGWFVSQCLALARAYGVTGKPEYARRAALILDRFAQAYPHMAVLKQWPYRRREVAKPTPPFPEEGGKWGRWADDEVPAALPEAYDLIHDSAELDRLSQEQGVDVRRRIENDFFRATVDYLFTFGKEPAGDLHLGNMAPFYTRNLIEIGRVIGEPAYVHWGYRWVGAILNDRFMVDGMWCEAPAYHYQTIHGVRRVLGALKGYSDPLGYRSPDGLQLKDLDLERQLPFVRKALLAPDLVAYPDGRVCPVHDTWAGDRPSPARERTVSTLLPGFGHASLGCGAGADQLQAQLHFSGGYGHEHADNLNFSLFAKGGEMLCDIGYTHTKLRGWTTSTVGHNTVAIDRRNQTTRKADGDLMLFVPDTGGLAVVEAGGEAAYPERAEVYRRELLLVRVSESDAYVVDLFRVRGGQAHDYLLHGSAEADMTAECGLALAPRKGTLLDPGETWDEPAGESSRLNPYGLIREVRRGATEGPFDVTFRYAATEGPTAGAGVRVHLLGGSATEVFLARSPRVRQAEGDDRKVYDFWMPQLVARRRGKAPLSSLFAAVHEPFRGQPFLREVRELSLDPSGPFCAAIEVRYGDFTDTIISTPDDPPYPERRLPGGIVVSGRLAVLREQAGKVVSAWLVDGTRVAKGDFALTLPAPRYEGTIESATRKADGAPSDAFLTSAALPAGDALAGRWMVVTHGDGHTHGYEIARVETGEAGSVIVLRDDPGLRIAGENTEECFFPRRNIPGRNRFLIVGSAVFHKGG